MEKDRNHVKLKSIIKEFHLEVLYEPTNIDEVEVYCSDVHRPGLQLTEGYYDYFDNDRIQILGKVEHHYMRQKTSEEKTKVYDKLLSKGIPALFIA